MKERSHTRYPPTYPQAWARQEGIFALTEKNLLKSVTRRTRDTRIGTNLGGQRWQVRFVKNLALAEAVTEKQHESLWEICRERLRETLDEEDYKTMVQPLRAVESDGALCLYGPNEWVLQRVSTDLRDQVAAICEEVGGGSVTLDVRLTPYDETERWNGSVAPVRSGHAKREPLYRVESRWTFDSFIEGRANQLAKIYAMQVAEKPAAEHNPLLIYGASGLGKTHLLHAIVNQMREGHSKLFVEYVTARDFRQEIVGSLRPRGRTSGRFSDIDKLKQWYKNIDVLLVDDIHFLAEAARTQEEMFAIFNELLFANRQMVFTSDMYPREIEGLEERLVTRFLGGQAVCVESPELETRIAILLTKAEEQGIRLEDDVALYMAERIRTNVRELEGALKQVYQRAKAMGRRIDKGLVGETLRDAFRVAAVKLSIENIQSAVADYYRIRRVDLLAETRERRIVVPRQMAMYLCTEVTDKSLMEIGNAFRRDHTTVMHARNRLSEMRRINPQVAEDCRNLLRELGNI